MIHEKATRTQRQERAKLYASLASKHSLEGLSAKEQRALFCSVRRAKYPWLDYVWQLAHGRQDPQLNLPPPYNLLWSHDLCETQVQQEARGAAWNNIVQLVRLKTQWVNAEKPPALPDNKCLEQAHMGWTTEAYAALCWEALRRAFEQGANWLAMLASGAWISALHPVSLQESRRFQWRVVNNKLEEVTVGVLPEDEILSDLFRTIKEPPFLFRTCPICKTIFVQNRKRKYCSNQCSAASQKAAVRGQRMRENAKAWRQRNAKGRKTKSA